VSHLEFAVCSPEWVEFSHHDGVSLSDVIEEGGQAWMPTVMRVVRHHHGISAESASGSVSGVHKVMSLSSEGTSPSPHA
jgi:hypothetical protein